MGVGLLKLCQWGQGWWRTRDWAGCVIEKQGSEGGERGRNAKKNALGRNVEKKC